MSRLVEARIEFLVRNLVRSRAEHSTKAAPKPAGHPAPPARTDRIDISAEGAARAEGEGSGA